MAFLHLDQEWGQPFLCASWLATHTHTHTLARAPHHTPHHTTTPTTQHTHHTRLLYGKLHMFVYIFWGLYVLHILIDYRFHDHTCLTIHFQGILYDMYGDDYRNVFRALAFMSNTGLICHFRTSCFVPLHWALIVLGLFGISFLGTCTPWNFKHFFSLY